jgi:MFS family permease
LNIERKIPRSSLSASPEIEKNSSQARRIRPWASLVFRDFRLVWLASVCTAVAIQVRNVAGLYQVYEISGSALQLGITGFLQAFPFVIFGLFAGAIADSFDRKKLLVITTFVQLIPSLVLGLLTMAAAVQAWHVYTLGFLGALVEVFNWPARSALIPRLVPRTYLMNAMTLNTIIIQMSFLLGPAIGGMLIDYTGLVTTYFLTIAMLLPGAFAILAMRTSGIPAGERRHVGIRSIFEGIEFIWIQRIILSLFLLDFGVTLVGFYRPILPIFAADVFNVGASGLGLLYGAPSAGAIVGSFAVLMIGDVDRKGVMVVIAALIFAGSLALLGIAQWFSLAVIATLILGFTDSISVAIRRTVVQLLAPDGMLGRASSLITVFAQATNGLGAILAGAAAQWFGASNALLVGSSLCFLMILAICAAIPQLWRYRS